MGWKIRSLGNLYYSLYVHAFIIGVFTGKFLYAIVVANKYINYEHGPKMIPKLITVHRTTNRSTIKWNKKVRYFF